MEKMETICIEITIAKKKWCILFACCPPNSSKTEFFEEISVTLNKAWNKYDNVLLAGDLNINTLRPNSDSSNHLFDLNDPFSSITSVTDSTFFKSNKGTLIDLILTSKPKSFCKFHSFVTGSNDCHKLTVSILRTSFQKLPPEFVIYRNKKNFHESNFLHDLDSRFIWGENTYNTYSGIFSKVFNYHLPLKQKSVRGNHAPFMTKELSKAIMTKSKAKKSYIKWPSWENLVAYKRAKNKYNSLTRKVKRKFFKEATKSGLMSNRTFWKTIKPFSTKKGQNTEYMKEIFHKPAFLRHRPLNLKINENHTTEYGNKSLRCLGPHIWNSLPNQIQRETDHTKFKKFISNWFGIKHKCNLCYFLIKYRNVNFILSIRPRIWPVFNWKRFSLFFFYFCLILLSFFIICELYIYIILTILIILK